MCGRFTLATPAEIVAEFFELAETPDLTPRYNIAPSQPVAAVVSPQPGRRELRTLHWGLVSSPGGDLSGTRLINARAETLAQKPAFREAFRHSRCLVIADGFYEWKSLGRAKQPYHIRMIDGGPFAFAALRERSQRPSGELLDTCAIVTGEPNDLVRELHDRMPVILHRADYDAWLDPANQDVGSLQRLLRPFATEKMTAHPVSTRVNRPENDEPSCIEPVRPAAAPDDPQGQLF